MSQHHGDRPNHLRETMSKILETPLIGATGTFPEGRLVPSDEGAIQFRLGRKDGNVIVDFGTPVTWLGMPPQQAVALAEAIIAEARIVARKAGIVLTVSL